MDKKGYTLIEVLIAMAVLVIVIALATLMFVKVEKMNQVIRYESSVSNIVNGMLNEIIQGNNSLNIYGLSNANYLYQTFPPPPIPPPPSGGPSGLLYNLIYTEYTTDSTSPEIQYYMIAPGLNSGSYASTGTDTTLWQGQWNGTK